MNQKYQVVRVLLRSDRDSIPALAGIYQTIAVTMVYGLTIAATPQKQSE
ncbi:hypothetical protein RHIZ404_50001 [Rhizobium sp. EC-SD404]|nr:hypothetical protein RHIZ404_50001 [Rhizobium sp. EC-SD404]